ncbi:hypothetical protein [uncultured Lacinutrix sp.]|uniref:hypothetical protein n=1 Tax=uncultured Lacinutrix sp. TaxID=574032 RepID=UPI002624EEB9|nr:hypothetical protein [uncultured Lacinutrix sp.]
MGKCTYCLKSAGIFKKVHKECEQKNKFTIQKISELSSTFFSNSNSTSLSELKTISEESFVSEIKLIELLIGTYSEFLDKFLDDGTLTDDEEKILSEYQDKYKLTQNELEKKDLLSKTYRASILRQLINGEELTNRITIQGNLPFKFQKSENLIWLFQNVELFEQRIKTTYKGGSQGISLKIAKGVYYRTSSFKGHPVKTMNTVPIASGMVALTNKHIYFSSGIKNFRINFNKIITIEPYSDGIGITKDGVTSKPQVFKNLDGWFCYNFIKNISE